MVDNTEKPRRPAKTGSEQKPTGSRSNAPSAGRRDGPRPAAHSTSSDGQRQISSERIKQKMQAILSNPENQNLSDRELTELLNKKGAKIARRTVAKYRAQLGLKNSYKR